MSGADADESCRGAEQPGEETFLEAQIIKTILLFFSLFAFDVLDAWIVGKIIDQYLGLPSVFVTYFRDNEWLKVPCGYSGWDILPI